jgi:hypothetical protein
MQLEFTPHENRGALSCLFCDGEISTTGTRGRPPSYCSKACKQQARNQVKRDEIGFFRSARREDRTCLTCGNTFNIHLASPKKYCNRECMKADPDWVQRMRNQARQALIVRTATTLRIVKVYCLGCGVLFRPISRNYATYCSRTCAFQASRTGKVGQVCKVEARNCPICDRLFVCGDRRDGSHQWKVRCSLECEREHRRRAQRIFDRTPTRKQARRIEARRRNPIRRAQKLELPYEIFDPIEIYERDRWFCGICGLIVDPSVCWPNPMSPSLDHVKPLALGGKHTRDNTQLTHLRCNLSKGMRVRV